MLKNKSNILLVIWSGVLVVVVMLVQLISAEVNTLMSSSMDALPTVQVLSALQLLLPGMWMGIFALIFPRADKLPALLCSAAIAGMGVFMVLNCSLVFGRIYLAELLIYGGSAVFTAVSGFGLVLAVYAAVKKR